MGRIGHCREHILDSGISLLISKGYNGTGVKDIVDAAGVPKGSFYNHFDSKEAFVVEALEKLGAESMREIEFCLLKGLDEGSPKQKLFDFFDANQEAHKKEGFSGGCLFGNLCLEMSDENEAIRATTSQIMCQVIKLIRKCLDEAIQKGELSEDKDPKELAEFIYYAWEGTIMRMKGQRTDEAYLIFRKYLASFFN